MHMPSPAARAQMTAIEELLRQHDAIKYSAYRTAMKLRTLQKSLRLDNVKLRNLAAAFDRYHLDARSGCYVGVDIMLACLRCAFEGDSSLSPRPCPSAVKVVPPPEQRQEKQSAELVTCWLLDVFDVARSHFCVQVLSFKVALVLMCQAPAEDKFRYLFAATQDSVRKRLDEVRLSEVLAASLKLPSYLGESSAFGGPDALTLSVRSCMEEADGDDTIACASFINWLRLAPQSMVWMEVFHRAATSEDFDHGMQCRICLKQIVGLRYRCVRCFRLNMCQACFLERKDAARHSSSHPIEEYYCLRTGDDVMMGFATLQDTERTSGNYIKRYRPKSYLPLLF